MNNVICNNAYGILGLLPNASQKEISRRVKEIEKYLQIDEKPQYDFDFKYYDRNRTIQNVHDAFFNISNINNQIMHHFFRVYVSDIKQLDNLHHIANNFNSGSISSVYSSAKNRNLIIEKNIAISLTLLLLTGINENIENLSNACIDLWHSILDNEKYLKDYKKIFLLDDEIGIEDALLDNLKESIVKELTQVFSDISKQYNNNQILSKFIDKFQLNDNIFNLDTVEEIYNNIHKSIKIMDSMNISDDGIFDDNEKRTLKECLQTFQDEFNKLIDLGLYDNEKTIILRDLVATKIRIQILDLFNNLEESDVALGLMEFAIYITGTKGLKSKLMDELKYISNFKTNAKLNELFHKIDDIKISHLVSNSAIEAFGNTIDSVLWEAKSIEKNTSKLSDFKDGLIMKVRNMSIDLCNSYKNYNGARRIIEKLLLLSENPKTSKLLKTDIEKIKELNPNFFVKLLRGILAFLYVIFQIFGGYIVLAIIVGFFCFVSWLYDTIGIGGICTIIAIGTIVFFCLKSRK